MVRGMFTTISSELRFPVCLKRSGLPIILAATAQIGLKKGTPKYRQQKTHPNFCMLVTGKNMWKAKFMSSMMSMERTAAKATKKGVR
jgi:hypothetical protein